MPEPTPRRRAPLTAVAAIVVLALLVGLTYLLTRPGDTAPGAPTPATLGAGVGATPTPGSPAPSGSDVQYRPSPSQQPLLPYSATFGPRSTDGGVATGFAHTEQGAAMAVQHALYETSGTTPPSVFQTAWATRWTGVPPSAVTTTQQSYAATTGATYGDYLTAPAGVGLFQGYLVDSGDGTGDAVAINTIVLVQARAGQAQRWTGGVFTLRWVNEDWTVVYSEPAAQNFGGKPAGMKVL